MKKIADIDKRKQADIRDRIKRLSESYVPEWNFDQENPDVGSTLGILFASQMEENIYRYNQVLHKYHTEFVNMLDISLLPAKPSSAVVILEADSGVSGGQFIRKGTKFMSSGEEEDSDILVFESDHDIFATSSRIGSVFMTNAVNGSIIPLKGQFAVPEIISPSSYVEPEDENTSAEAEPENEDEQSADAGVNALKPFYAFGNAPGIEQNALIFYHPEIFALQDNPIYVRFKEAPDLVRDIQEGKFTFLYPGEEELSPFDEVSLEEDGCTFRLVRGNPESRVRYGNTECSAIVLKANGTVEGAYHTEGISFSSAGEPHLPESVSGDLNALELEEFEPFGDTISLYSEFHIGDSDYFSKVGSEVTVSFDVSYYDHPVYLTPQEEVVQLKVVKRKPRVPLTENIADVYVDEVAVEYFNGSGWKRLPLKGDYKYMFRDGKMGHIDMKFTCPRDWSDFSTGAFSGRCIRIIVLKSENCYMRPCIFHYPRIRNMSVSFSYKGDYKAPRYVQAISGTRKYPLEEATIKNKPYTAFIPSEYHDDAIYLGFTRKLERGPISIMFTVDENIHFEELNISAEYLSPSGFRRMNVNDMTDNLSKTGLMVFVPPEDMCARVIEGRKLYWMKLVRNRVNPVELTDSNDNYENLLPHVTGISLNGVVCSNINTLPEKEYYMEEVLPRPSFNLNVSNILDADIWVNEMGQHSREDMHALLAKNRDGVRAEYRMSGEISAFYVLWREADRLDAPDVDKRSYTLDRMNGIISFGDGINTYIPKVTGDVCFKAKIRVCDGGRGNVPRGSIDSAMGAMDFITIKGNPMNAYGGSDIESLDKALERGANILGARRRLVSAMDYRREILAFSDNIDKVACIGCHKIDGSYDSKSLSFVLLPKDTEIGSFAFHDMANHVEKHLLEHCECSVSPEDIHIVEPVFVEISVDIWVYGINSEDRDSYVLSEYLNETMEYFLNPVSSDSSDGWEIGTLPTMSQMIMSMGALKSHIGMGKTMVTAKYTDSTGTHEKDLNEVEVSPFMVCKNGRHNIHFLVDNNVK